MFAADEDDMMHPNLKYLYSSTHIAELYQQRQHHNTNDAKHIKSAAAPVASK